MSGPPLDPSERLANFLGQLQPEQLVLLPEYYATEIEYQDPINEATGLEQLDRVLQDLFKQLQEIRFEPLTVLGDSQQGFYRWMMHYQFRGRARSLPGVSYFQFNDEGKAVRHTDYWDASFSVYGEFPLVGLAMKGVRRVVRVRHP